MKLNAFLLSLVIFFFSTPAFPQNSPYELEHDLVVDGVITGTGLLVGILLETAFKNALASQTCKWCSPPGIDVSVRKNVKWDNVKTARVISDTVATTELVSIFSFMAFVAIQSGHLEFLVQDLLLITESVVITMLITSIIKTTVGRQRPFAHFEGDRIRELDSNLSFFSGHSSSTSSIAAAASTLAFLRGYDEAPWILALGGTLSLATAYLRVAGDAHYLTDILPGLLIGTGLGIGIPLLFHGRKKDSDLPKQQSQSLSLGLSSVNYRLTF